jgi:acetylglutamate kinase
MKDQDDPSSLIRSLTTKEAEKKFGDIIKGGMIPKVESCLNALKQGVQSAYIINGMKKHTILHALLTKQGTGTRITAE